KIWEVATGREMRSLATSTATSRIIWHPTGSMLLASQAHSIRVWQADLGLSLYTHTTSHVEMCCPGVSPDGKSLAAPESHANVHIVDILQSKVRQRISYTAGIEGVCYSPDSRRLATVTRGQQLCV